MGFALPKSCLPPVFLFLHSAPAHWLSVLLPERLQPLCGAQSISSCPECPFPSLFKFTLSGRTSQITTFTIVLPPSLPKTLTPFPTSFFSVIFNTFYYGIFYLFFLCIICLLSLGHKLYEARESYLFCTLLSP